MSETLQKQVTKSFHGNFFRQEKEKIPMKWKS